MVEVKPITCMEDIEGLVEGDIVPVKNRGPAVFEGREEDMMIFYWQNPLKRNQISVFKTPRNYVTPAQANMIYFQTSMKDIRVDLSENDEGYNQRRKYMGEVKIWVKE